MTCSNCDYHFCWLCLGSQADHVRQGDHFMCNINSLAQVEKEMAKKGKKVQDRRTIENKRRYEEKL